MTNQLQIDLDNVFAQLTHLDAEERLKALVMAVGRVMVEELDTLEMSLNIAGKVPVQIDIAIYPEEEAD